MNPNHSLLDFFLNAGPVVKLVMLILLAASVISWTFIIQRRQFLKSVRIRLKQFEHDFWSASDMKNLFTQVSSQASGLYGVENLFLVGFKEFKRFSAEPNVPHEVILENVRRAMIAEEIRVTEQLQKHLSFLATVGSTSPYIGLFGTVWGIMTAFSALGAVQQATIAMVAPGISEALIATAIGLFAAIPAVIAYNRFTTHVESILNHLESFQEDFIRVLQYQLQIQKGSAA